jgi:hypothetical protein
MLGTRQPGVGGHDGVGQLPGQLDERRVLGEIGKRQGRQARLLNMKHGQLI